MSDFARDAAFGRLVGVELPDDADVAAIDALVGRLVRDEQAFARGLAPARRATWAGGRVALRAALAEVGAEEGDGTPILTTPRGAPALPPGFAGSISHKRALAVALAARIDARAPTTLGIDVELDRAPRVDISRRVLGAAERARLAELASPPERDRALMLTFAAKEAIYKALDPWLARFIAFGEVEIARAADATLRASFSPRAGERSFAIELSEERAEGFVIVAARCL